MKMTEAEVVKISGEVKQLLDDWMTAWEKNDCGIISEFAHPELTTFMYSGTLLSRAEWQEACGPVVAERDEFSGAWTEMKIRVLSPDAVVFESLYRMTIKFKSGVTQHWPSVAQGGLVERTAHGWAFTLLGDAQGEYEEIGA